MIKLPTVLAFDRNLEPSDGVMFSGNWKDIDNEKAGNLYHFLIDAIVL